MQCLNHSQKFQFWIFIDASKCERICFSTFMRLQIQFGSLEFWCRAKLLYKNFNSQRTAVGHWVSLCVYSVVGWLIVYQLGTIIL
jgi:hypothetical protein